jgi:hypothetical protein
MGIDGVGVSFGAGLEDGRDVFFVRRIMGMAEDFWGYLAPGWGGDKN